MVKVVGVRFKKARKIYYFDPNGLDLDIDTDVIVETSRGLEYGLVVVPPKEVQEDEVVQPLKPIIRLATPKDREVVENNIKRQEEAFAIGLEKIAKHGLPMKLVDVEYTFDNSKLIFYFTADGRVDFRELVKDLAGVFRMRIELRQIGVRDEARMLGGLGPCGREMCCASFLGEFAPVSIKMAKEQNLSLNPTKISGICGRLMCCLRYETEAYKAAREELPCVGDCVCTGTGHGTVVEVNPVKESVIVDVPDSGLIEVKAEEIAESCDELEAITPEEAQEQAPEQGQEQAEETTQAEGQSESQTETKAEKNSKPRRPRRPRRRRVKRNKQGQKRQNRDPKTTQ
ncbi:MAG: stage 0 sporulation family protein [Firmicutes bacterium]|nr:stage 0 sporulation family protein [Bacillota bacterium]